jgi:hypothetical protein
MEPHQSKTGAGDETRTRDINLGKVALYQLSYTRVREGVRVISGREMSIHDSRQSLVRASHGEFRAGGVRNGWFPRTPASPAAAASSRRPGCSKSLVYAIEVLLVAEFPMDFSCGYNPLLHSIAPSPILKLLNLASRTAGPDFSAWNRLCHNRPSTHDRPVPNIDTLEDHAIRT